MRRWHTAQFGMAVCLALTGIDWHTATAPAQDADPLAGVAIEMIGSVEPEANDGHALVMLRLTLDPGVEVAEHGHPGAVVLFAVSGEFETTFTTGNGQVTRGGNPATNEAVELDTDLVLGAGDSVSYDHDAHHVMRNSGDEPLVLMATGILAADQPGFIFVEATD